MRLSGGTKPIIFGFILATGITLIELYLAFAAGRSGRSRGFRTSKIHRQR
jgi:hypothetical protein